MDVNKTLIAVNEFRNAMARAKTFLEMERRAEELETELTSVNEGELKGLAGRKDLLTDEVQKLTTRRDELKSAVDSLEENLKAKHAFLDKQIQQRKDAADAEHAAVVAKMRAEIDTLKGERAELTDSHERILGEMATQKRDLQSQIQQLKSQAQAMVHA